MSVESSVARAAIRREAVLQCAEDGATVDETVQRAGFSSKDALWVFCKRHGLREEYAAMRERQPVEHEYHPQVIPFEPMRRVGTRRLKHNGITVWTNHEEAA